MQFLPTLVGNHWRPAEAKAAFNDLTVGQHLVLERDSFNAHDSNAVKVLTEDGIHLGFIDKGNAADIALYLDRAPSVIAEGHEPKVTVEVLGRDVKHASLVVEISTGFEVETEVKQREVK